MLKYFFINFSSIIKIVFDVDVQFGNRISEKIVAASVENTKVIL